MPAFSHFVSTLRAAAVCGSSLITFSSHGSVYAARESAVAAPAMTPTMPGRSIRFFPRILGMSRFSSACDR